MLAIKASLDHHRSPLNHWAAETHGDKSESPAARNVPEFP
jgi:hypothetical protein